MKKSSIIVLDPSWSYNDKAHSGKRGVIYKYKTMTIQDMMKLNISKISKPNSIILMWVTFPFIQEGLNLIKQYGFKYKTIEFFWHKIYRNGKSFMGMGNGSRANVEVVLRGKKGKGVKVKDHGIRQFIESVPEGHSKKPDEFYKRVELLYGKVSRTEVFATKTRKGWQSLGYDIDGKDIRKVLK